ncbi:MAG: nucleotidyltransferase family protein [Planctomycetota bacterium]
MQLLAGTRGTKASTAAAVAEAEAWPAVIQHCRRWNVLPALAATMRSECLSLPASAAAGVVRESAIDVLRTKVCLRAGCDAVRLLIDAGIPAVAFKGAAVVAELHADGPRRVLKDVDVVIDPDTMPAALTLLEARGYRRSVGAGKLAEYIAFVQNSPGAAGNEAVSLTIGPGADLDLHWKLGRIDVPALLDTAKPANLVGIEVPIVRPAFGLLLSVHHAVRNDFVPDHVARDVIDCIGWFARLAEDSVESAVAREYAVRWGLGEAVAAMSLIARHFGHESWWCSDGSISAGATDLAGLYLHQLDAGPINTDLAYLGSSRAIRQVLAGAWSGWGRYTDMMRAFEASNGEVSLSFWQRLRRLAGAARRLSLREWRQIRTLARAKDRL